MEHAILQAKRATCARGSVGCVIVSTENRRIISTGYNGPASGEPHCTGIGCAGYESGCERARHAEANALDSLDPDIGDFDLYCTHAPCPKCFDLIHLHGTYLRDATRRIFFMHDYREMAHLRKWPGGVYRISYGGYITKFPSNTIVPPESFYAR